MKINGKKLRYMLVFVFILISGMYYTYIIENYNLYYNQKTVIYYKGVEIRNGFYIDMYETN